jgi:UDP-N-acetylglucosamine--N-acetylmuramyl-(pentapeptide) pyrophosphoryl-undecaprenol N-acetylglucosamine transferase
MKNIFLAGGRTGGPLSPILAISDYLSSYKPIIIGISGGYEDHYAFQKKITFEPLLESKLSLLSFSNQSFGSILRGVFGAFWSLVLLKYNFWRSVFLLIKYQPRAILSAGGITAIPLIWAAKMLNTFTITRVKIIVHQQDPNPGLVNKLTARYADLLTATLPATLKYKGFENAQMVFNPINTAKFAKMTYVDDSNKSLFHFAAERSPKPLFLVFGGGSGAKVINQWVVKNITKLTQKFRVIHLTGKLQKSKIEDISNRDYFAQEAVFEDMELLMKKSDLVLCRAGMGSITELHYLAKPAFLVPLEHSHQEQNANSYSEYFETLNQSQSNNWLSDIFEAYPSKFEHKKRLNKVEIEQKLQAYYSQIENILK